MFVFRLFLPFILTCSIQLFVLSIEDQVSSSCGTRDTNHLVGKRISHGHDALPGEFPWQVKLRSLGTVFCAGVLVHQRFVVTAARCFLNNYNPQLWSVVLRDPSSGTKRFVHVDTIFIHGSFEMNPYRNDVAMVKLVAYDGDADVQVICLPEDHSSFSGLHCVLTGWGAVNTESFFSPTLQKQTLSILDTVQCGHWNNSLDATRFLCAAAKGNGGPCQGDTGSSIVCRTKTGVWQIAGLVSEEFGCQGDDLDRGLYTNMAAYSQWIQKMIIKKL